MSAPIGDPKSGGGVGTLPPQQEQKTLGRAKDQSQSENVSPPKSGVAGLSCPAVSTLPDAQPATDSFGTKVSGGKATQNQDGMCHVQPPQPPAQTLPTGAVPAALSPTVTMSMMSSKFWKD